MNRLASNGETTATCGVPLSRLVREPSGRRNGAFNHLSTYSRTHFWSSRTWCATALTMRSQGTVSKNFVISRSITCLLYTSDAADEEDSVDLGGRRIIKKKKKNNQNKKTNIT